MAGSLSPSISSTKGASAMARGPQFDTYDPAKIDAMRQAQKPAARNDHKTAPGPQVEPCAECGDIIGLGGATGQIRSAAATPPTISSIREPHNDAP